MPRNWKKASEALSRQRLDDLTEIRFNDIESRSRSSCNFETVQEYLARGGTIKKVYPGGVRKTTPTTPPQTTVTPCPMGAIDAARLANTDLNITPGDIAAIIPKYRAALPRRSWIAKFKANLNNPERFITLT